MKIMAGGHEVEIPTDAEGQVDVAELRQTLGMGRDRMLIHQKSTGENVVLPKRGRVQMDAYSHLLNAPVAKRG